MHLCFYMYMHTHIHISISGSFSEPVYYIFACHVKLPSFTEGTESNDLH